MSFSAYPSYKDSGVEWLGRLPSHWQVKAIKRDFAVVGGSTPKSDVPEYWDGDVSWITPSDLSKLSGFEIDAAGRNITEAGLASCGTRIVPQGSVVLSTRAPIGSLAIAAKSLCTNQGCKSLVPLGSQNPEFLAFTLSVATAELNIRGKGTTFLELSGDELGSFKIPFPDAAEQASIVGFLEKEVAKIDVLIEEQKRLIELLREKRHAVISQSVTKGLDPTVPMRESGVEWLGHIPAHWQLRRGRFLFEQADEAPHEGDGVVTAFRDGQVTLRENRRTDGFTMAVLEVGYQHVRTGDLVIHGMDAFAGAIGVSESEGKCTPEYAVLRARESGLCNHYYAAALRLMALRNFIYVICPSVRERAPRFRYESFKDVWLPLPPPHEQKEIMNFIDTEVRRLDGLASEAADLIGLATERRKALISAAVTGKIDVRGLTQSGAAT
jgi:type I restriction enzyme, S subunit